MYTIHVIILVLFGTTHIRSLPTTIDTSWSDDYMFHSLDGFGWFNDTTSSTDIYNTYHGAFFSGKYSFMRHFACEKTSTIFIDYKFLSMNDNDHEDITVLINDLPIDRTYANDLVLTASDAILAFESWLEAMVLHIGSYSYILSANDTFSITFVLNSQHGNDGVAITDIKLYCEEHITTLNPSAQSTMIVTTQASEKTADTNATSNKEKADSIIAGILLCFALCFVAYIIYKHHKRYEVAFTEKYARKLGSVSHAASRNRKENETVAANSVKVEAEDGTFADISVKEEAEGDNMIETDEATQENMVQMDEEKQVMHDMEAHTAGADIEALGEDEFVIDGTLTENPGVLTPGAAEDDFKITSFGKNELYGEEEGTRGKKSTDCGPIFEGMTYAVDKEGAKEVKSWLKAAGFAQYYEIFIKNGFDSLDMIQAIQDKEDLKEIGITLKAHQLKVFLEIQQLTDK